MWCSMAAQENRVDDTVGAGFKPAHTIAVPQNPPNSPICVVLQLARNENDGESCADSYWKLATASRSQKADQRDNHS